MPILGCIWDFNLVIFLAVVYLNKLERLVVVSILNLWTNSKPYFRFVLMYIIKEIILPIIQEVHFKNLSLSNEERWAIFWQIFGHVYGLHTKLNQEFLLQFLLLGSGNCWKDKKLTFNNYKNGKEIKLITFLHAMLDQ